MKKITQIIIVFYTSVGMADSWLGALREFEDLNKQQKFHLISAVEQMSADYKLPPELVSAVIRVESFGDPCARNPESGATGLMQVMPATAKEMGIYGDLFDPEINLGAGTKYLKEALDLSDGDFRRAAAIYYGGPQRLSESPSEYGPRTRRYATKLIPIEVNRAVRDGWKTLIPETIQHTNKRICT